MMHFVKVYLIVITILRDSGRVLYQLLGFKVCRDSIDKSNFSKAITIWDAAFRCPHNENLSNNLYYSTESDLFLSRLKPQVDFHNPGQDYIT